MNIDIDKLSAKREEMINSLVAYSIDWYANKDPKYWRERYESLEFSELINYYYSMGTVLTYQKITKEYEER